MTYQQDSEPFVSAKEIAERLGLSELTLLRHYREGRIPGRRMPGTLNAIQFRWSEVLAAWDCRHQLSFEDEAA
jgi:excisionase family DNA binding protein